MSEQLRPEVFEKAIEVLEKNKWCRGSGARDKKGVATDVANEDAVAFCALGALCKVEPYTYGAYSSFISVKLLGGRDLINWNDRDSKDKRTVIRLFKKAAQMAKGLAVPPVKPPVVKEPVTAKAGTIYKHRADGYCVLLTPATLNSYGFFIGGKFVNLSHGIIGSCHFDPKCIVKSVPVG